MKYGWLSLIPPLVAISMAFITKRVVLSLLSGIIIGAFILSDWNIIITAKKVVVTIWEQSEIGSLRSWAAFSDAWNIYTMLFLTTLGVIVYLINRAGGAKAYGDWASKKIKSRSGASLATMLLGLIIFIDDYFNSLTVGAVMKPVTDKFKISRAKLAYILDSTAAPVVILAPVSSWVAEVISKISIAGVGKEFEGNPFTVFLKSVPFNTYAWITLLMVFMISKTGVDYGPMKTHERTAKTEGNLFNNNEEMAKKEEANMIQTSNGKIYDLLLPMGFLVLMVVGSMLYSGDYWLLGGKNGLATALESMNSVKSLFWGGIISLIFTLVMFIPRKLIPIKELPELFWKGAKLTLPSILILVMAWSIGSIIKNDLQTGQYLASLIQSNQSFPMQLLPAVLFLVSCVMAFAIGSSWGTFGVMIPIAVPLAAYTAPELLIPVVASILAGAIFGDHASPISDTTILSSTGAGCNHIDHVQTQAPYAVTVAGAAFIGFIFAGYTNHLGLLASGIINFSVALVCFFIFFTVLTKKDKATQRSQNKIQESIN